MAKMEKPRRQRFPRYHRWKDGTEYGGAHGSIQQHGLQNMAGRITERSWASFKT